LGFAFRPDNIAVVAETSWIDTSSTRGDLAALDAGLRLALTSTEPLWDLATAAHLLITQRRHADAMRVFDAIVHRKTLDLSAYCNALWVVQRDNTGLPVDVDRSRRYLSACLPHAPMNPAIHLNAAAVLMELDERDRAVDELIRASRRSVPIAASLNEALLLPLHEHARWASWRLRRNPYLPQASTPIACAMTRRRRESWRRSCFAELSHGDPRVRQRAARHTIWWRDEDGDDGHGRRAAGRLLEHYVALGLELSARVTTADLITLIGRTSRATSSTRLRTRSTFSCATRAGKTPSSRSSGWGLGSRRCCATATCR